MEPYRICLYFALFQIVSSVQLCELSHVGEPTITGGGGLLNNMEALTSVSCASIASSPRSKAERRGSAAASDCHLPPR